MGRLADMLEGERPAWRPGMMEAARIAGTLTEEVSSVSDWSVGSMKNTRDSLSARRITDGRDEH